MEELRLVGVNDDGTRVVFVSPEGTRFTTRSTSGLKLLLDATERAWVNSRSSPARDCDHATSRRASARVSAESVATTAGITMERGRRYAGPVLAEREHMVREARRAVVRRPAADGAPPRLGDIVTERLVARDVDVETVTWDAWRRDDGRWLVQVSLDDSMAATWLYDVAGRSVSAEDDEARLLSGERAPDADDVSLLVDVLAPILPRNRQPTTLPGRGRKQDSERPFVPRLTAVGAEDAADDDEDSRRPIEISAARCTTAPRRERMVGHTDKQALADGVRPGRRATVPSWDDIVFGRRTTAE